MQRSKLGMWRAQKLPVEGLLKEGGTFSPKNGMWKGKGLDLGAEPPRMPVQDFAEYPQQTPPPPPTSPQTCE